MGFKHKAKEGEQKVNLCIGLELYARIRAEAQHEADQIRNGIPRVRDTIKKLFIEAIAYREYYRKLECEKRGEPYQPLVARLIRPGNPSRLPEQVAAAAVRNEDGSRPAVVVVEVPAPAIETPIIDPRVPPRERIAALLRTQRMRIKEICARADVTRNQFEGWSASGRAQEFDKDAAGFWGAKSLPATRYAAQWIEMREKGIAKLRERRAQLPAVRDAVPPPILIVKSIEVPTSPPTGVQA